MTPNLKECEAKLTAMQEMCFIRAMRIDCSISSVIRFISHEIGQASVEQLAFDTSIVDSVKTTPLIIALTQGARIQSQMSLPWLTSLAC